MDVLEEWIVINGKPKKVMRDNGKQFTSKTFRHFLKHNYIKDKPIPKSYPQLQGKVEAYNKIVKNEFLAVEDISGINDGKLRYEMFVKAYNETRDVGIIDRLNLISPKVGTSRSTRCGNIMILESMEQKYLLIQFTVHILVL